MSDGKSLEDRIARLEENLFFQERLLDELNAAFVGQQRQLDAVERAAEETRSLLEEVRLLLDAGGVVVNVPPPHYR